MSRYLIDIEFFGIANRNRERWKVKQFWVKNEQIESNKQMSNWVEQIESTCVELAKISDMRNIIFFLE